MSRTAAPPRTEAEIIFLNHGATITDLGTAFRLPPKEVRNRLAGRVSPVRTHGDNVRYAIADAAPFLCEPEVDLERLLKNMSPSKMPAILQDQFWKAQRNRLAYEEDVGDLWRTTKVVQVFAEVAKSLRMTLLMTKDTVEQQVELTPRQRQIIVDLMDGAMRNLQQNLIDAFADYQPAPDEHGRPLEDMMDENYDAGFD